MYSTAGPSTALSSLRFADELEEEDLYDFSDVQNKGQPAVTKFVNSVSQGNNLLNVIPQASKLSKLGSSGSLVSIAESAEELGDDAASSHGSSPLKGSDSEASFDSPEEGHMPGQQGAGVGKLSWDDKTDWQLSGGPEDDDEGSLDGGDDDVMEPLGLEGAASVKIRDGKLDFSTCLKFPRQLVRDCKVPRFWKGGRKKIAELWYTVLGRISPPKITQLWRAQRR
jgi:hypothetical protein